MISKYIDILSALFAVDGVAFLIVGVAFLIVGVTGIYLFVKVLSRSPGLKWTPKQFNIACVGAAMVLGGAAFSGAYVAVFLGAYILGKNDSGKILARWVQVVPAKEGGCFASDEGEIKECLTEFSVRAVLDSSLKCADVSFKHAGSNEISMLERSYPGLNGYMGFKTIRVCEKRISINQDQGDIKFNDNKQIGISRWWGTEQSNDPGRIIVLGDTGCRNMLDRETQEIVACASKEWPFKIISNKAAGEELNLVLHVGDYMYVDIDSWSAWQTAFFKPAKQLLMAAPWVMVRGNHEGCGNFGQTPHGFFLFFGLGDVETCKKNDDLRDSYALDLPKNHLLIVADSSKAFEPNVQKALDPTSENNGNLGSIGDMVAGLGRLASAKRETIWLTTHVPVFALEHCEVKKGDIAGNMKDGATKCIKSTTDLFKADSPESSAHMFAAWQNASVEGIDAIISGDRHVFQIVQSTGNPLQITVGTGGVNLDLAPLTKKENFNCLSKDNIELPDENMVSETLKSWEHCSNKQWGYATAKRNGENYKFTFKPINF